MVDNERHTPPVRYRWNRGFGNRKFQRQFLVTRRLLMAAGIFYRRLDFEQQLILKDIEPRFCVSWDKLREIADNPQWLAGGFGKFMHRLHRLARHETDEAVRAYHAVTRQTSPPEPLAQNEPPREE